jgi:hypothetical protein
MEAIIVPKEAKLEWCNTWSLKTHSWETVIGYGNENGMNLFHRCKFCGEEQELTLQVSSDPIIKVTWGNRNV